MVKSYCVDCYYSVRGYCRRHHHASGHHHSCSHHSPTKILHTHQYALSFLIPSSCCVASPALPIHSCCLASSSLLAVSLLSHVHSANLLDACFHLASRRFSLPYFHYGYLLISLLHGQGFQLLSGGVLSHWGLHSVLINVVHGVGHSLLISI